jgi:hypothetical protein
VGNLSIHSSGEDIQKLFHQYGKITVMDSSGPGPHPRFAFVQFVDPRDAADAVHTWNGHVLNGRRLKVERVIHSLKNKKSQHKATQPGGKFQMVPKPRGRTKDTLPTKSPPLTEQLIEFEDNLEAKNAPPPPLTMEETRLAATHNLEEVTAIKGLHNWDNPSSFPRSNICTIHGAPKKPRKGRLPTDTRDDVLDTSSSGEDTPTHSCMHPDTTPNKSCKLLACSLCPNNIQLNDNE